MLKLAKWVGIFLLALPAAAVADTIEIRTQSNGMMRPDNAVLAQLGMTPIEGNGALPYTLMLDSIVDTGAPGYYEDPLEPAVSSSAAQVEVSFTIGGQRFHYAGPAKLGIIAKPYGYSYGFELASPQSPAVTLGFGHFTDDPGEAGHPLNPPTLDNASPPDAMAEASISVFLGPQNPGPAEIMSATASSFSIRAVSLVPEPAPAAMLAGGLAMLLLRAARQSSARFSPDARGERRPAPPPARHA